MLYRDIRFNLGSCVETIKNESPVITGATFGLKEKGYALETSNGKYAQYPSQLLPNGAFSVVVWARLRNSHVIGSDFSQVFTTNIGSATGIGIHITYNSNKCVLFMGANSFRIFNYSTDKNWHCFIFTIPGNTQNDILNSQLFVDSNSVSTSSTTSTSTQENRGLFTYVGNSNTTTGGCHISRIKVYDEVISANQILQEQDEFNNFKLAQKPKRGFAGNPKPTDLSREVNNTPTEMITAQADREFTSDTGWWNKTSGVTIGSGTCTIISTTGEYQTLSRTILDPLKYCRCTIKVTSIIGGALYVGTTGGIILPVITTPGVYTGISLIGGDGTIVVKRIVSGVPMTATISYISYQQLSGLVAAYHMSPKGNVLVDISGNNIAGTLYGRWINTLKGINLNGTGRIQGALADYSAAGSISFRCKFNDVTNSCYLIRFNESQSIGLDISISTGFLSFIIKGVSTNTGSIILINKWYTINCTWLLNGTRILYMDGIQIGSNSYTSAWTPSVQGFSVGANYGAGTNSNVEIQDFKLHNRILSPTEIKQYHNQFVTPYYLNDISSCSVTDTL